MNTVIWDVAPSAYFMQTSLKTKKGSVQNLKNAAHLVTNVGLS